MSLDFYGRGNLTLIFVQDRQTNASRRKKKNENSSRRFQSRKKTTLTSDTKNHLRTQHIMSIGCDLFPSKLQKSMIWNVTTHFKCNVYPTVKKVHFELDTACLKRSNGFAIDLLNHTSLIYLFGMKWILDTAGKNCR